MIAGPQTHRRGDPAEVWARRHFHRGIDTTWRRTSYSGLLRAAQQRAGVSSEPEVVELDDEVADIALTSHCRGRRRLPSPMGDLPTGAKFGTLVHAVLENADPLAADLAAELRAQVEKHSVWWPVDSLGRRTGLRSGADARHPARSTGR